MPRRHRLRALRLEVDRRSQRRRMLRWITLALLVGIPAVLLAHGLR